MNLLCGVIMSLLVEIPCLSSPVNNGIIDKSGNVGQGETIRVTCDSGFEIYGRAEYKCGIEDPPLCRSKDDAF
jgi:hypothetical protein